eukprot:TRINITY_DN3451_c1_g6_i1.p1 TRINITY_DN3451_c1_g6~~TRINITY_DN3451_c1_g6_i1.p1  ORF type:complete len:441 (+),score=97.35 TRINITY_DN3451_c1_g6_i1:419-1741(+)
MSQATSHPPRQRSWSRELVLADREGSLFKQGSAEKGQDGGSWKKRWFALYGSTLSYYDSEKKTGKVRTHQIRGGRVDVVPDPKCRRFPIRVTTPDAELLLAAKDAAVRAEWVDALEAAVDLEPCEERHIPGQRKRNASVSLRFQRGTASVAMKTKAGRAHLKAQLPEHSSFLAVLDACVAFARADVGDEAAAKMEKHFIQLAVKTSVLDRHNLIDHGKFEQVIPYLHRISELLVQGAKEDLRAVDYKEIASCFDIVSAIAQDVYAVHVNPKTLAKGKALLEYPQNPERVRRLFCDPPHRAQAEVVMNGIFSAYEEMSRDARAVAKRLPVTPLHCSGPLAKFLPHLQEPVEMTTIATGNLGLGSGSEGQEEVQRARATSHASIHSVASQPEDFGFERLDDSDSPAKARKADGAATVTLAGLDGQGVDERGGPNDDLEYEFV